MRLHNNTVAEMSWHVGSDLQHSVHSWLQASHTYARLGVRTASQIALTAFLSSVIGSVDLCQQILALRLQEIHFR